MPLTTHDLRIASFSLTSLTDFAVGEDDAGGADRRALRNISALVVEVGLSVRRQTSTLHRKNNAIDGKQELETMKPEDETIQDWYISDHEKPGLPTP